MMLMTTSLEYVTNTLVVFGTVSLIKKSPCYDKTHTHTHTCMYYRYDKTKKIYIIIPESKECHQLMPVQYPQTGQSH